VLLPFHKHNVQVILVLTAAGQQMYTTRPTLHLPTRAVLFLALAVCSLVLTTAPPRQQPAFELESMGGTPHLIKGYSLGIVGTLCVIEDANFAEPTTKSTRYKYISPASSMHLRMAMRCMQNTKQPFIDPRYAPSDCDYWTVTIRDDKGIWSNKNHAQEPATEHLIDATMKALGEQYVFIPPA
jgi:hypothetical protein